MVQHRRSLVGLLLVVLCGLIVVVASSQQEEAVVDPDEYRSMMSGWVEDVFDLAQFFVGQQSVFLPLLPPDPSLTLVQPVGEVLPFDWEAFPPAFNENLVVRYENSVPVYPLTIVEDPIGRDIVFFNADGKEICAIPSVNGYNPFAYVESLYPSLFLNSFDSEEAQTLRNFYDPARIQIQVSLIPQEYVEPYLYVQDRLAEEAAALAVASDSGCSIMMRYDGASVTSIVFTAIERMTNFIRVTVAYPYDGETYPDGCFTNRLDIFQTADLLESWWELTATIDVSASTNWIEWTDTTMTSEWVTARFYVAGNADLDSDGDGFADAREKFMYHSDPYDPASKPVSVSGSTAYSGIETGTIYALATAVEDGWSAGCSASLAGPGPYTNNAVGRPAPTGSRRSWI